MTIIAGFSSSRHGPAPLNLALRIARCTGENIVAAAVVERPWPPSPHGFENEYLDYVTAQAMESLKRIASRLPADVDVSVVVHRATSVPAGLLELAGLHNAALVAVGSSSSGLMGRITLGSVTDRLVHTANVPVAIAPRGYPAVPEPLRRLTAGYGGGAEANGLIATSAELCKRWSLPLRIASFTVRPVVRFSGSIEPEAEHLVVDEWARRTSDEIVRQLHEARARTPIGDAAIVVGTGDEWRDAVEGIDWDNGDLLLLGSGSAGVATQVFLGSVASRILRHSPVPVMIVPRQLATA